MPFLFYALMTWTTRDRAPLITPRVQTFLRNTLPSLARRLGVQVMELGIVEDHVHALLRLPVRVDIPRLAQAMKGASARIANRQGTAERDQQLHWASGYDFRSVGPRALGDVRVYLQEQREKHARQAALAREWTGGGA